METKLCWSVMLDAQYRLILNNGVPVDESTLSTKNLVKFLRLYYRSPDGIIYGISTQDILIKDSYLQMIEEIECDRKDGVTKGCTLIGSPGIRKLLKLIITHLMIKSACSEGGTGYVPSLYIAFYLTCRYTSANIIYQQPDGGNVTVTLLINQQNRSNVRWHDFKKHNPRKYYAPIWTEKEIWDVWEWNEQYRKQISKSQVKMMSNHIEGLILKCPVHHHIQRKLFMMRVLTNNNKNDLELQELDFKYFDEIDKITPGCYNVPKDPTLESIDSLTPNRNGSNYLYQTTIAEKHNVGFYSFCFYY
ncbi:hypothetical protein RhiirB3_430164 [Rhizophagus irregularis]|nr:hypothetical protein RhiirB3_430164 [Rhizophagus irregularis]